MASYLPLLLFCLLNARAVLSQAPAFLGFGNAGGLGVWVGGRVGFPVSYGYPPPGAGTPSDPQPSSEYTALQAWKSAITEDPSGVLASWVGPNVCSYKGVFCSSLPPADPYSPPSSGHVVFGIDLNKANLRGTLVKEFALLSHLSILHLNGNRFTGTVPDAFSDIATLTELDLSNNRFSGPFPAATLDMPSLVYLDLRFNSFSGNLPEELFMKGLDAIFLNNNFFEGQIPMSLWSSPASVISLANNRFSGPVPASFGYMGSGIKEVLFLNNKLTGCIPEGLGFLSEIEVLDLSFNSLTGHLPSTLSCLSSIEVLNIAHNQLSGVLPDLVCSLRSLLNLTISFNFFSGFGQGCGRAFRSVWFDFVGNCIPGRGMQRPPPECTGVPGEGLSCFQMSPGRPVACGGPMGAGVGFPYKLPSSAVPSSP
ncbi:hypothetical protein Taro_037252 [Colocasia esculenta]|uniref:Cell wall hydroxyproline-rich glycoprotein n=1 Tax=Colocasia esculenta TaxID=4460 RepID=A0A843W570_COLES|nr:hypothetical protein [Colocasia esculenta]